MADLAPADEDCASLGVLRRDRVHSLGGELVGNVGDDQVTSWRERRQVAGDDTGRVVVIRDVVQARDEQQSHWLGEIQELAGRGENLIHVAQIGPDHCGGLVVGHQRLSVQEYHGIVVDIDDPSVRMPGLGDLIGVGTGWQPGPDVEELADSVVAQEAY